MAWNRSKEREQGIGNGEQGKFPFRGLGAGAIVVLGAGIAAWLILGRGGRPEDASADPRQAGLISDVGTNRIQKAQAAESKPKHVVEMRKLPNGTVMKYVDGKKAWLYSREDYHGPVVTSAVSRSQLSLAEKTFKNRADRQIASLLTMRPGGTLVGDPNYAKTFVRDFLASYDNPFTIEPGDTPEQKELKRRVAEVKGDLKARMEQGEDIAAIMKETRQKMRELGVYKRELMAEVRKLSKQEGMTSEDFSDFVSAANKMLSDRGIEPFKVDGFLKYQIQKLKQKETSNEPR